MNTIAPSLVHSSATYLFYPSALSLPQAAFTLSIFRKHGYGFNRKNPLQTNVLPVCVRHAQAGAIITPIHE